MTDLTAREVLDHECHGLTFHAGNAGTVPYGVAILAMLAYASRSVEETRRDERDRCARIADAEADDIEREPHFARDPWHQGRAAMARSIASAIRLPDAPERDGE